MVEYNVMSMCMIESMLQRGFGGINDGTDGTLLHLETSNDVHETFAGAED